MEGFTGTTEQQSQNTWEDIGTVAHQRQPNMWCRTYGGDGETSRVPAGGDQGKEYLPPNLLYSRVGEWRWPFSHHMDKQEPIHGSLYIAQAQEILVDYRYPRALNLSYVQHVWKLLKMMMWASFWQSNLVWAHKKILHWLGGMISSPGYPSGTRAHLYEPSQGALVWYHKCKFHSASGYLVNPSYVVEGYRYSTWEKMRLGLTHVPIQAQGILAR